MLEDIREKSQGLVSKVILGLIILTFAVAGIGSYTNSVDTSVAEVNGEKISQNEFNKSFQAQRNRMQQQYGEMFDTLSADSNYMAQFRQSVLDNLINEVLLDQNADSMAMKVSYKQINQAILNMTEFHVDGVFNNDRYLALINQAGFYQSSDFKHYLRTQMTRRQLSQAIVMTEFSAPYQEEILVSLQNQKRDFRVLTVVAEQFNNTVEVSDEEINTYYTENQFQFQNQEKVMVDYISLDVNEIAKSIEVSESEIETYYLENIDTYRDAEQRRVSHILIETGDDETAAKALAESLLVRIQAGEDFAVLAQEYSTDTLSGENGGDLDWIEMGTMDESFDESAYGLANVGDVSEVITTPFGFHIIKLTDLKAEQTKSLEEVKDKVADKVSKAKAQDEFFELQQELARLAYEFPDTLDDAAGAVNGTIKTSAWLTKTGNTAPFNESKLLEAAFSDVVITEHLNSDIIEVSDELAVVLRLNQYQEANAKPLSEVSAQIKELLVQQKASNKTQEVADELLVKLTQGEDLTAAISEINAEFSEKVNVSRFDGEIDTSITRKAFSLPHPKEGVVSAGTALLSNGDIALIEIKQVTEGEFVASEAIAQQQQNQLAQSAYESFVASLTQNATITKKNLNEIRSAY